MLLLNESTLDEISFADYFSSDQDEFNDWKYMNKNFPQELHEWQNHLFYQILTKKMIGYQVRPSRNPNLESDTKILLFDTGSSPIGLMMRAYLDGQHVKMQLGPVMEPLAYPNSFSTDRPPYLTSYFSEDSMYYRADLGHIIFYTDLDDGYYCDGFFSQLYLRDDSIYQFEIQTYYELDCLQVSLHCPVPDYTAALKSLEV